MRNPIASALPDGWEHLDHIDLSVEFRIPVTTLEEVPFSIRSAYCRIQAAVFRNLVDAYEQSSDREATGRHRGWKLFCLLSRTA